MKIPCFAMTLVLAASLSGPAAFAQNVGSVLNATFTSNVANGVPVDFCEQFANTTPVVYYYGELIALTGQLVRQCWSLEGKRMQEVSVEVMSERQPACSKMPMQPPWTGNWTVEVLDGTGQIIDRRNFAFTRAY